MNKRFQVWLPLLFALVMVWGMVVGYQLQNNMSNRRTGSTGMNNASAEVLELIKEKYVDKANMDTLNEAAIDAVLDKLDPHTIYIPAMQLGDVNDGLRGSMQGGLGIEYQVFADTATIMYVVDKGPAAEAGIVAGDQLIKINDTTVANQQRTTAEIRKLLRSEGALVKLTLLRNQKLQDVTVKRGLIPIPSLDAAYMAAPGTGYIRLNKFAETTYKEFMGAMEKLNKQGMKKLILDLRNNGGGVLDAAVNIADEFLEDGRLIVFAEGDKVKRKNYESSKPGVFEKGALVLLMDENSASASEVLAGALQDNDRCTIIGHRSFGKGLVQEQYTLSDGGALRITVSRYYTPLGRSIQKSYAQGRKVYNEEVLERFHHTDTTTNSDSIYTKGKLYTTVGGKKVYGGGGIAPDIYVPYDTVSYVPGAAKFFNSNVINNFTYQYYKQNKTALPAWKTAHAFATSYSLPSNTWNSLVDFAKSDSISLPLNDTNLKSETLTRVKALLARQVWRNDGYFEVENATDAIYKKAIQVISKIQ